MHRLVKSAISYGCRIKNYILNTANVLCFAVVVISVAPLCFSEKRAHAKEITIGRNSNQRCSIKNVLLKIWQNLQKKNILQESLLFSKVADLKLTK